jgi:DNA-directed RNA polymerase subunit M/transcription elongation factor TFIIS
MMREPGEIQQQEAPQQITEVAGLHDATPEGERDVVVQVAGASLAKEIADKARQELIRVAAEAPKPLEATATIVEFKAVQIVCPKCGKHHMFVEREIMNAALAHRTMAMNCDNCEHQVNAKLVPQNRKTRRALSKIKRRAVHK